MTVIPQALTTALGLIQVRGLRVEGLGGAVSILSTCLIELAIDGLSPITVEVLASHGESGALLGRDVINRYKIELHGPAQ